MSRLVMYNEILPILPLSLISINNANLISTEYLAACCVLRVECRVIGPTTSDTSRLISEEIEWSSSAYLLYPDCVHLY